MAHAEIAQVWPRDGRLRFVGRLHGEGPAPGQAEDWRLLLVLRGDEEKRRLRYAAPLDGEGFDVSLPVEDLVADGLPVPAQWDLYLTGGGSRPAKKLRLARLLDDIENKKKIMVFPAQPVSARAGKALVKPYYTVHDNLSVECLPQES
ncbi:hypothetical protein [Streptomyces sp. 6N223]|uniref:hypothetical protein n=1 Tax=Streptomyces sp. 6N223 TaxID=3457412 RepID=UPI003FD2A7EF